MVATTTVMATTEAAGPVATGMIDTKTGTIATATVVTTAIAAATIAEAETPGTTPSFEAATMAATDEIARAATATMIDPILRS